MKLYLFKHKKILILIFIGLIISALMIGTLINRQLHQVAIKNHFDYQNYQIDTLLAKGEAPKEVANKISLNESNVINWYAYREDDLYWPSESIIETGYIDPNQKNEILEHLTMPLNQQLIWKSQTHYYMLFPKIYDGKRQLIISMAPIRSYWHETFYISSWMMVLISCMLIGLFIWKYRRVDQGLMAISNRLGQLHPPTHTVTLQPMQVLSDQVEKTLTLVHQQEALINTSEHQKSVMLENLPLGILIINAQGEISMANQSALRLLSFSHQEMPVAYQTAIKSYPLISLIDRVRHHKQELHEEVEFWIPTQKLIDINVIPYGQSHQDGDVLVLLYDLTQIKKLEGVRTEFVANASHELRTPITAIRGFAEVLQTIPPEEQETIREFNSIILKESQRLEAIIEDILSLSKIEQDQEVVTVQSFDLIKTIQDTLYLFQEKLSQKSMSVDWIGPTRVMIESDQQKVSQILTNLVENAINYSHDHRNVTIKVEERHRLVKFSVIDQGVGIPEDELERIFERFYRVDKGRSRQTGGTGLGLAIVRHLVRALNGTITVESKYQKGSTFTVRLPKYWE